MIYSLCGEQYNTLYLESDMEEKKIYLIKDLSRLSGLSIYTIKYYLKMGLVKEVSRSQETNFRYFNDITLERLQRIIALRREKVPLKKIQDIITRHCEEGFSPTKQSL